MTCKDCIYYDVCNYHITEETDMTVKECSHSFKNKSDFVEVVRCKDCKYWENGKDYEPYCNHFGNMMTYTKADDFCSYGERRDNNG